MSSIITHEILYEILTKEKSRPEIQKIDPAFFLQLDSYLEEKELILKSQKEKNSFPEEIKKTEQQLRTINQLATEIIERRKRKILDMALLNSRTPSTPIKNILPKEQDLYNSVLNSLTNFSTQKQENHKPQTLKEENPPNHSAILIRFLHAVPKFVGTDTNIYGPFTKEDIANLPVSTAKILLDKKRAEKVQHENPKSPKKIL
jgi:DNA replication initiation complex subunit (GINS family)